MILTVKPSLELHGSIQLPSSKSYSIRASMIASCGGKSFIKNYSDCNDASVALLAAKFLGAKVKKLNQTNYRITAATSNPQISKINVQESGTVLRFILPLIALQGQKAIVTGEGTLKGRPNKFLIETLRKMGSHLHGVGAHESIPIKFLGGHLLGGTIEIDGSLSSQFISALLIACPILKEDTHLRLKGKNLVSTDYITMTLNVLEKSQIKIRQKNRNNI